MSGLGFHEDEQDEDEQDEDDHDYDNDDGRGGHDELRGTEWG